MARLLRLQIDEALADAFGDGLDPVVHRELLVDVLEVGADGGPADAEDLVFSDT